jgi:hypothetical protein
VKHAWALAIVLFAGVAHADAYDAAMAQAAIAKEKALDSGNPIDWNDALDKFIAADAIKPTRESKFEIAVAASKVKADDLAVEAFEAAIALGLEGTAKTKADEFLNDNVAKMVRLTIVAPAGATVMVGDRKRTNKPVVFAGPIRVRVTHEGKTVEKNVTFEPGAGNVDVTSDFAPPPPPPPPPEKKIPPPPIRDEVKPVSHTVDWALIVGGTTLAIAGGVTWAIATKTVSARRESLASVCHDYRQDDPELCWHANNPEDQAWAQEDSDMLRTWRPMRVVGAMGAGVGLVVAGIGVIRLSRTTTVSPLVTTSSVGLRVVF